jgi:3-oxoacyl-[acyl-carrier protein] reductase
LSKQLGPKGVTVNAVTPGTILTPIWDMWLKTLRAQRGWPDDQADNERRYVQESGRQSILRMGQPRDIAVTAALLASPLSGYVNGANFVVDGGAAA